MAYLASLNNGIPTYDGTLIRIKKDLYYLLGDNSTWIPISDEEAVFKLRLGTSIRGTWDTRLLPRAGIVIDDEFTDGMIVRRRMTNLDIAICKRCRLVVKYMTLADMNVVVIYSPVGHFIVTD